MYIRPWSRAGNRLLALAPLGDVPSGRHAGESLAPISIRSICQYRTNGHGTDSGKFIYAGEARKIFSNSVIETGVLRGCWLAGLFLCFFWVGIIDGTTGQCLKVVCGDMDGIHRYYCGVGFGCWPFSYYVGCCTKRLRPSQREVYTYYIIQYIW